MQKKRKIAIIGIPVVVVLLGLVIFYFWSRPTVKLYEVTRTLDPYITFMDCKRITVSDQYGGQWPGVEISWRLEKEMPAFPAKFYYKLTAYAENGTSKTQGIGSWESAPGATSQIGYISKNQYSYFNLKLFPEAVYVELYDVDESGNLVSDVVRIYLKTIQP